MSADFEARLESAARAIGVSELKHEQRKVLPSFVRGNGVFVSPTAGYGKSVGFAGKKDSRNVFPAEGAGPLRHPSLCHRPCKLLPS